VTGLLDLKHKTLSEMRAHELLPYSVRHSGALLAAGPQLHRASLARAKRGGVLAVDLHP
jgi:hypothetical protein